MDLILTNGHLLTMDADEGWATALAITDGRIAAVGTDDEIAPMAKAGSRKVDLGGRVVLPGFADCHCHLLGLGLVLSQIDLAPSRAPEIPSLLRLVRENAPPGDGWIRGRGYDQNRLAEKRHPNRIDLDPVTADRPIALTHASGHAMAVNSVALRLAGVDRNTSDPAGGMIERDPKTGEPTGVLFENAMGLIHRAVPKESSAQLVAAIGLASRHVAAMGITSAAEASVQPEDLPAFFQAAEEGGLSIRCQPFLLAHRLSDAGRFPTPFDISRKDHPNVPIGF